MHLSALIISLLIANWGGFANGCAGLLIPFSCSVPHVRLPHHSHLPNKTHSDILTPLLDLVRSGLWTRLDLDPSLRPSPLCRLLLPVLFADYAVEERPSEMVLMQQLEEGGPDPLVFVLNANLLAMVKLVNCELLAVPFFN